MIKYFCDCCGASSSKPKALCVNMVDHDGSVITEWSVHLCEGCYGSFDLNEPAQLKVLERLGKVEP